MQLLGPEDARCNLSNPPSCEPLTTRWCLCVHSLSTMYAPSCMNMNNRKSPHPFPPGNSLQTIIKNKKKSQLA